MALFYFQIRFLILPTQSTNLKVMKKNQLENAHIYLAWLIAIVGMLSSLYFSQIKHLIPCELCWYQRILMYPLVAIIGVGLSRKQYSEIPYYVLPFSVIGSFVALYHVLLEQSIVPDTASCSGLVACSQIQLELFNFLTIPMMSLLGFLTITILMIMGIKRSRNGR